MGLRACLAHTAACWHAASWREREGHRPQHGRRALTCSSLRTWPACEASRRRTAHCSGSFMAVGRQVLGGACHHGRTDHRLCVSQTLCLPPHGEAEEARALRARLHERQLPVVMVRVARLAFSNLRGLGRVLLHFAGLVRARACQCRMWCLLGWFGRGTLLHSHGGPDWKASF